jgi:hypothetical protein
MMGFVCVYIPRTVIDRVGLLDERYVGYGYDDDDYCKRVRDAGLKLAVSGKCIVEHASLPSTFRSGQEVSQERFSEMFALNRRLFEEKWKLPNIVMPSEMARLERIREAGESQPVLSILICGVVARYRKARLLINALVAQAKALPHPEEVEILYACDHGQEKVGAKRNRLLAEAEGKYSCFVDDDDKVTADYVATLLAACEQNKDAVGISGFVTYELGNKYMRWFRNSPQYKGRIDNGELITDRASHLCPIRTEIARSVPFQEINCAEDRDWMDRIFPMLQTYTVIEEPIYLYQFSFTKTCTQGGGTEHERLARCQGLR